MHPNDELIPVLKRLRLSGLLETLELRTRQAAEDNLAPSEFLLRLLSDELERREVRQLELRLRRANFEHAKTLDDFDFSFNNKLPKSKIIDLATCLFVERKENIALVGPTGVGKSHIAQALGHRACRAGYTVLHITAHQMLSDLRAARADHSLERKMSRYISPNLLILDDLGLRNLSGEEPVDLYELLRLRYERGSIIITSNRSVEEWFPLFHDDLLASAALDRFLHHAHVLTLDGHSYRTPPGRRSLTANFAKERTPEASS